MSEALWRRNMEVFHGRFMELHAANRDALHMLIDTSPRRCRTLKTSGFERLAATENAIEARESGGTMADESNWEFWLDLPPDVPKWNASNMWFSGTSYNTGRTPPIRQEILLGTWDRDLRKTFYATEMGIMGVFAATPAERIDATGIQQFTDPWQTWLWIVYALACKRFPGSPLMAERRTGPDHSVKYFDGAMEAYRRRREADPEFDPAGDWTPDHYHSILQNGTPSDPVWIDVFLASAQAIDILLYHTGDPPAAPAVVARRRRGRTPASADKIAADGALVDAWEEAHANGATKATFCKARGIKIEDLEQAQSRMRARRNKPAKE